MPTLQPFTQDEKNKTRLAQGTADAVTGGLTRLKDGTDTAAFLKGTKVASGQGFKMTLHCGTYWTPATYPGGNVPLVVPIFRNDNGAPGIMAWRKRAEYAGSILALSGVNDIAVAVNTGLAIFVNGTLKVGFTFAAGVTSGQATFNKGVNTFVAGDILTCLVSYGATTVNTATQASVTLEMDPT